MKELKLSIYVFGFVFFIAVIPFFLTMYFHGNTVLSSNSQDWANFGSYIGGVLAPTGAFLAAYQLYRSHVLNSYLTRISLVRESLSRFDSQIEDKLNLIVKNQSLTDGKEGETVRDIIIATRNNKIEASEDYVKALTSLFGTFAVFIDNVRYYLNLLEEFPTKNKDSKWPADLEKLYWISKYSPIFSDVQSIIGKEAVRRKCTKQQLESLAEVLTWDYSG